LAPEFSYANPAGPVVVNGKVGFAQQGKQLTVTNTPGAIINWKSFSIARDEATRFAQQSPSSAVLNRVVGGDPSQILGALQSNGRVFLINPNGIVFGAGRANRRRRSWSHRRSIFPTRTFSPAGCASPKHPAQATWSIRARSTRRAARST
jgi:filamentous hemagglutinin family protein